MKKSLLILSVVALAATSARAYDTLEPGTADAPNYYTITANRGDNKILTYSYDGVTAGSGKTHLYRQTEVIPEAIWAVTPGSVDGTIRIQNLVSGQYLMDYQNGFEVPFAFTGAYANTTSTPADVYYKADPSVADTYVLSLRNTNGSAVVDGAWNYFGLDASGGQANILCGNWYGSGGGLAWGFTKVDMDNDYPGYLEQIKPEFDKYLTVLMDYAKYVAPCAEGLGTTIKEIMAITDPTQASTIKEKYDAAVTAANETLQNGLLDHRYAMVNLRRFKNNNAAGYFLGVTANGAYAPTTSMYDSYAWFSFAKLESGETTPYYIHNIGPNDYMGDSTGPIAPHPNSVFTIYPALHSFGGYNGVAFTRNADHTGNALNMDESASNPVVFYNVEDTGSIWALVDVTELEDYMGLLTQYAAHVAPAAEYFEAGTELLKETRSIESPILHTRSAITDAITQANSLLQTGLEGKVFAMYYLRGNGYLAPKADESGYSTGSANYNSASTWFKFVADPDHAGGYFIQDYADDKYISASLAPSESDKQVVYPFVNAGGGNYGVSFSFNSNHAGDGLNSNGTLSSWGVSDAGSIWGLIDVEDGLKSAAISDLEKYVETVAPAANIFNKGIEDIDALEFTDDFVSEIQAVSGKAISDANDLLKTALAEKSVSIRSLRNGYIYVSDDAFKSSSEQTDLANYDFAAADGGGYTIYSPVADKYMGPVASGNMTLVEDKANAVIVYPVVFHFGDNYGVAFPLSDSDAAGTDGLNANSDANALHKWQIDDLGSIFAIQVMGPSTEISEVTADDVRAQGIYDLSGRKLIAPVRGINIINGRKVLVK
ncbi:MAG: hypothetical protein K2K82_06230 [Muribaculaceae bacterium]|nr:hypothetical protein [Muribaculaceae bacterium]